ncbi:sulfur carrier protein ThiS [Sediminibacillus massiliensis]|uniref:sulfur carrier protein ThiS n=1 Tax=Sediminibacillus massiliensis TaxID=1926277 RepID=UPI000988327A|nr:sulfur carrier protein ThiS [Sediminibacillus massiliensis]
MELIINGDKVTVPDAIENVSQLLEHYNVDQKVVIVELNGTILEKETHRENHISGGDKMELVHFVGGG